MYLAKKFALVLLLLGIALTPMSTQAEDVILVPACVSGPVSAAGQDVTSISMYATWTSPGGTNCSASQHRWRRPYGG